MNKAMANLLMGVSGVVLGFGALGASQLALVQAAGSVYVKIPGLHGGERGPDTFDIYSISYGLNSEPASGTSAHGGGKTTLQTINFEKRFDSATPQLMADVTTGKRITGDIYFETGAGPHAHLFMQIHFTGVVVSDQQSATSSEANAGTESVAIQPFQETLTYTKLLQDGSAGGTSQFSWNAETNSNKG